jgi:hypothetical protein
VAAFHEIVSRSAPVSDVYRFQTSVIDEQNNLVHASTPYPEHESAAELALSRMLHHREFFIQNLIFSRSGFERSGGLVDLPCGFFAEDASFAAIGKNTGITTLRGGRVDWRQSAGNLNAPRPELVDQKLEGFMQYLSWAERTFKDRGPSFRHDLRVGASSWIRRSVSFLGGVPTPRCQIKFYWFFLRLSPYRFLRVFHATRAYWNR